MPNSSPLTNVLQETLTDLHAEADLLRDEAEKSTGAQKRKWRGRSDKIVEVFTELNQLSGLLDYLDAAIREGASLSSTDRSWAESLAEWGGSKELHRATPARNLHIGDIVVAPTEKEPRPNEPLYVVMQEPEPSRGSAAHAVCAVFVKNQPVVLEKVTFKKQKGSTSALVVTYPVLKLQL